MFFSRISAVMSLSMVLGAVSANAESSFLCSEPGGKRLVHILGNEISNMDGKTLITIDSSGFLNDPDGKRVFIVDDHDVRPGAYPGGVKIATLDGDDIRHADGGDVLIHYKHPSLSPTFRDDRTMSIEGPALSKRQLVAALYILKPDMFKLSEAESAAQLKAMAEANAEEERKAAADQSAGKWTILNSSGIVEKLGKGDITIAAKKGGAYPVTFDTSSGGGPLWSGVGWYKEISGDKTFWAAYGTAKTIGMCVYEIKDGGVLEGIWYPWYIDGDAKNTGTESLKGPANLDGEFAITAAKAPTTGAAYTGTVTIKPANIVGSNTEAMPYTVTWTLGTVKINGVGIRTSKYLFVATSSGADACIAKFIIHNGTMTGDWFKLGSTEKGSNAAMN